MVCIFLLLILGVTFLLVPDWAGWISASLWVFLFLLPLMGFARVNRLMAQERYGQARRLAAWLRWLHPADGMVEYPVLLRGLELGQQGRMEDALHLFQQYQTSTTRTGRTAIALLYRMDARWDELLAWMQINWSEAALLNEHTLNAYYLRSLGETGDLNGLVRGVASIERKLERTGDKTTLDLIRLFAFAFCGWSEPIERLFKGALSRYSPTMQQFWLATAELASGNESLAQQHFLELRDRVDPVQQAAIDWRLSQPRISAEQVLSAASQNALSQIAIGLQQEARYSNRAAFFNWNAHATHVLIGINGVIFGLEVLLGGSHNPDTMYHLGVMVPQLVFAGDWWRVLSANFLHIGILHLLVNMLGLLLLGSFVESLLGSRKMLISYFFSGIGSMLIVAIQAISTNAPVTFYAGASGAIMGLLGVMVAIFFKGWRREQARAAARQLRFVLLIVGLQALSDLMTPQVSMVGHLAGAVLGFLAGMVL